MQEPCDHILHPLHPGRGSLSVRGLGGIRHVLCVRVRCLPQNLESGVILNLPPLCMSAKQGGTCVWCYGPRTRSPLHLTTPPNLRLIEDLKKGQTFILHYLDDFMALGFDEALVAKVTSSLVKILVDKRCLILPGSVLAPVGSLAWLGTQFDFVSGSITNLEGAMVVAVAKWLVLATGFCARKRVQSATRKLKRLARPHACLSLVLAGRCAHSLWGPGVFRHTPTAILRSLASVLALSFKVWSPLPSIAV